MNHPVPHLSELGHIPVPTDYRRNPTVLKAYLTGFMNAWLTAHDLNTNGPSTSTTPLTPDDF